MVKAMTNSKGKTYIVSTEHIENPRGFSEIGENKQLYIAIVRGGFYQYLFSQIFKSS